MYYLKYRMPCCRFSSAVSTAFEHKTGDPNLSLSQEIAESSLGLFSETPADNKNHVSVCSVKFQNNPVGSNRTSNSTSQISHKIQHIPSNTN